MGIGLNFNIQSKSDKEKERLNKSVLLKSLLGDNAVFDPVTGSLDINATKEKTKMSNFFNSVNNLPGSAVQSLYSNQPELLNLVSGNTKITNPAFGNYPSGLDKGSSIPSEFPGYSSNTIQGNFFKLNQGFQTAPDLANWLTRENIRNKTLANQGLGLENVGKIQTTIGGQNRDVLNPELTEGFSQGINKIPYNPAQSLAIQTQADKAIDDWNKNNLEEIKFKYQAGQDKIKNDMDNRRVNISEGGLALEKEKQKYEIGLIKANTNKAMAEAGKLYNDLQGNISNEQKIITQSALAGQINNIQKSGLLSIYMENPDYFEGIDRSGNPAPKPLSQIKNPDMNIYNKIRGFLDYKTTLNNANEIFWGLNNNNKSKKTGSSDLSFGAFTTFNKP